MICTIPVQFQDKNHMISIYITQTKKKIGMNTILCTILYNHSIVFVHTLYRNCTIIVFKYTSRQVTIYHTMICTIPVQFQDKNHTISIYITQSKKKVGTNTILCTISYKHSIVFVHTLYRNCTIIVEIHETFYSASTLVFLHPCTSLMCSFLFLAK